MHEAPTFRSLVGDSAVEANEWLEDFNKYMAQTVAPMASATRKKTMAATFAAHIKRGSDAKTWWDGLTAVQQADWAVIEALFGVRWPAPRERVIDVVERRDEFHAVRLAEDDLNTKVTIGRSDRTRWAHVAFAEKLKVAGEKAGLGRELLIADALEQVPQSIAKLMAPHAALDWDAWCDELAALPMNRILAEQQVYDRIKSSEKESEVLRAAVARLEEAAAQAMQTRGAAPSPPSTRWNSPQTQRRVTYSPQYDQTPTRENSYSSNPQALSANAYNPRTPPATPAVAAQLPTPRAQQVQATPSPRGVREMTPGEFPSPVASRLFDAPRCSRCGQQETAEHNRFSCTNPPLPEREQMALMRARFTPRGRRAPQVAQLEEHEFDDEEDVDEHELALLELQHYEDVAGKE